MNHFTTMMRQIQTAATRALYFAQRPGPTAHSPPRSAASRLLLPDSLDQIVQSLTQLADPDTVLEKLGRTRADLRSMEGDDEISQCLETRRDALVSTPWRLEPGEGQVTDWVRETMAPHLEAAQGAIWSAVPYGYSVVRPVYLPPEPGAPAGAQIGGLAEVQELEFERFSIWSDGVWYRQDGTTGPRRPLEPWETDFLYFITVRRKSVRNPYGEALLSRAYWPWYFRHNGWRFWMQALERFGTPLLIGHAANGDTDTMASELAKAVQDAVIAVGQNDTVEAVKADNAGEAFDKAEGRLVQRIQKLILGQTLTSSVDGKGSYAAANVHDRVRHDKRNADLRLIAPSIQRIVNAIAILRFGTTVEVPQFVLEDGTGLQMDRATRDSALVQAGAIKLKRPYFIRTYDYEDEDFEIPPAASTKPGETAGLSRSVGSGSQTPLARNKGKGQRFTEDQEDVEELAGYGLAAAQSPINVVALRAAIMAAENAEDLAERLAELYSGNNGTEFRELLERTLFAADVLGYTNAETARGVT